MSWFSPNAFPPVKESAGFSSVAPADAMQRIRSSPPTAIATTSALFRRIRKPRNIFDILRHLVTEETLGQSGDHAVANLVFVVVVVVVVVVFGIFVVGGKKDTRPVLFQAWARKKGKVYGEDHFGLSAWKVFIVFIVVIVVVVIVIVVVVVVVVVVVDVVAVFGFFVIRYVEPKSV